MAKGKAARQSKSQLSLQCVAALLACYGLASLAIDNGSLLVYFLAIVCLIIAGNRAIKLLFNK